MSASVMVVFVSSFDRVIEMLGVEGMFSARSLLPQYLIRATLG